MRSFKPTNNNGSILLKFRVQGHRYIFTPIPGGRFDDPEDYQLAEAIIATIQADVKSGQFDPTLEKYRRSQKPVKAPPPRRGLLELWDTWVDSLDLAPHTKADHYQAIRRQMEKSIAPDRLRVLANVDWFLQTTLAPVTFNKRLGYLKAFARWAHQEGYFSEVELKAYAEIRPRKGAKTKVEPFTKDEIQRILDGFEKRFPHYKDFVAFLLFSGVRTSEAIGLRWRHIDLVKKTVSIIESMPRDKTGNGYARIRKSTKTENQRILVMTPYLAEMFERRYKLSATKLPDSLVFTSARGKVIDSGNFREDYWTPVLKDMGVPYRRPYTTRHTLLSHAIEQGMPLTGVAYIAGHADTRMVMTTYGHVITRPELPDILSPDILS